MAVFRNYDVNTRVFTHLQRADGRTLELAPGETCDDVDLPDDFDDPWLKPAKRRVTRKEAADTTADDVAVIADVASANSDPEPQSDADSPDVAETTVEEN